jgi:hypothetical protein
VTVTGDEATTTGVPAAWYPCPADPRLLRWWDGSGWTEHTVDPAASGDDDPALDTGTAIPTHSGIDSDDTIDADSAVDTDDASPAAGDPAPSPELDDHQPAVPPGLPEASGVVAPPQFAPPLASTARSSRFARWRDASSRSRLPETGPARSRSTYASVEIDTQSAEPPESAATVWVWALAAVPLLQAATLAAVPAAGGWLVGALLVAPVVVALLIAHRDSSALARRSLPTAGWGWAAAPLLYLISRAVRVGRSTLWPFAAWAVAQLTALALVLVTVLPAYTAMTEEPRYDRAPWPSASDAVLTPDERAGLLTPDGMSEQIVVDLRTDGSEVGGATCPSGADTSDGAILTCRVDMEATDADVRVQVTDGYPNVAFVILGFEYD